MKEVVILAAVAVAGFIVWKNKDKLFGSGVPASYPAAPPQTSADNCSNMVAGTGLAVASTSADPRVQAIGVGSAMAAPHLCSVMKGALAGAKVVGKLGAKGVQKVASATVTAAKATGGFVKSGFTDNLTPAQKKATLTKRGPGGAGF